MPIPMDDDIDRMVVGVRADTAGFARDVAAMRDGLQGPLVQGADKAAKSIETSLLRAVQTGRLGFDSLRTTALTALDSIAASALKAGVSALLGGGGGSGGGASIASLLTGLIGGSPGRATGGPVSPGRAYTVGERGPELFVPTASGRIDTGGSGASGRDVSIAITINAPAGQAPGALQQSSRQVARAVRAALADGQ